MSESWKYKALGKLGTLTSSKRIYKKEYIAEGVPFYRSKEIKELAHAREISLELFISHERYNEIKSQFGIPQEGDLLLTAVGTIGEIYIVKKNEPDFYFKDGNIMWLKDFETLDPYFLKYTLTLFVEQLKAISQGSAYNALTIEKLKKYAVPEPSISEQQQIVAILDKAFEAIDQAKANIEKNIENAKELFQSKLNDIFSQKGKGWEEKKLKEVCDIKPNKKESKEILQPSDEVSFVPMKYLGENIMYFNSSEIRQLKDAYSGYVYFREGDVVLAKITPCFENGKLGIARDLKNGVGFGSSEYIPYRVDESKLFNEYLYFFLNREVFRNKGERLMSGAVGHKRIQPSFYEEELIPIPSIEEQKSISSSIKRLQNTLDDLESKYEKKLEDLEELKKSILQKAFAGELTNKAVEV
ncbi:restriction endonuclease subunit S [Psychroflexus sp. CAK1W]|uniref:restriction endonuclease subunit S n=1 Tax=Psychroflexus curvus TaxID=2873595 RepID=UPI001CCFA98A|nr:restriction endonuclease subunit S [Psychroflexus curvus]MBZ9628146.1 restriction endonuclease subunit S [Psychroflexus curvus]